jgi:Ca2+-binding EF-hand superfamily protein
MTAIIVSVAALGMSSIVHAKGDRPAPVSFAELDTNNDAQLDAAELKARGAVRFAKLDVNSDGFLSVEELTAAGKERASERAERMLKHLDANEDGKLSAEEMNKRGKGHGKKGGHKKDGDKAGEHKEGHKDRVAKLIERFDTDGNGTLSEEEFAAASEKMSKHKGSKKKKQGE